MTMTTDQLAIGEADANIFHCPRCSRPQAVGTTRCAGCGLRTVAGIPLGRVAGFVAAGLVAGLLVGGGVVAAVTALTHPGERPAVSATGDGAPTAPGATIRPTVDPSVPSPALAALRQSALVNQRLLTDGRRLRQALDASRPAGADIAPILRSMVATASIGQRVTPTIDDWVEAGSVSASLRRFYASVSSAGEDGLAASIRNSGAYVSAGRRLLKLLDRIPALDADARALAASAGAELPALQLAG
jgi:hypothetical protein